MKKSNQQAVKADSNLLNHRLSFGQWLRLTGSFYQREIALSALIVTAFLSLICENPAPLLVGLGNVARDFKNNQARKNVIVGGGLILICITLLSCVSSYQIYKEGFADTPQFVQAVLSLFAVCVVEGAFIWLVYGFTRAFSSFLERVISLGGMTFLVCVMLTNIVTHFMMVKQIPLVPFQQVWLSWGAVSVFIVVLVFVLAITLADPVSRLIRMELRYQGRQHETIIQAKSEGLESEQVQIAMAERAELEARMLADRILGEETGLQPPPMSGVRFSQQTRRASFEKKDPK